MKSFKDQSKVSIKTRAKQEEKQKHNWKRKPTPIEKNEHYQDICRIFPSYVVKNFKYFELITAPKQKIKDWDGYLTRLKKKISCMKSDFLL
jgi:hypothetical protein|tara:strand:- start:474 stop:746 length:273 start_codon:yes stop_codon:yes gene_type:complete